METAYLPDALDQEILPGDYLIDDSGKAYIVDRTENSFIRQGFLRVRELRLVRGDFVSGDSHTYCQAQFAIRLDKTKVPVDKLERRSLYRKLLEPTVQAKVDELRRRRSLRRK